MDQDLKEKLSKDPDGLLTYEYIANNIDHIDEEMPELVDNMIAVDSCGQFCVSAARYLHALATERFHESVDRLVKAAIEKDRNRDYIGQLLPALWGADYADRAGELNASDDNFRRIYKRIYSTGI
ncbi:MAG: hypothetical protein HDS46_02205 [Bacteroides sp.]|nr:hypothetical protein [Bacteroides sp.]MBD5297553.1 hypothetical protein [Bacteroides sp.]MBD5421461.1 hypothetical protein [Bacteroides sp.]MDE6039545.1 hypothetical protein [Paramuribaculum sp.]MDE6051148.1 hypothetical protein [Paramuribaculum sp.]